MPSNNVSVKDGLHKNENNNNKKAGAGCGGTHL